MLKLHATIIIIFSNHPNYSKLTNENEWWPWWEMPNARYLMSPSIFAMCPNICAKEFGIIPRSSGTVRTPSMVNVLPVPVCPYAKIVPGKIESKNNNSHQRWEKLEFQLVHQASSSNMLLAKNHLPSKKILLSGLPDGIFMPCSHHHAPPYNNFLWVFTA